VEYLPAPTRRVNALQVEAEVLPGPHRRVSSLMVEVEYIPGEDVTRRELHAAYRQLTDALHNAAQPGSTTPLEEGSFQTELSAYQTAIYNAFGVSLTGLPWGIAATHFVREGLEAAAAAFASFVRNKLEDENLSIAVDRYLLFRNISGPLTIKNGSDTSDTVALTAGSEITVNRRLSNDRNYVMTPNNVIHELGHFVSRSSGYGTAIMGSIEYDLDPVVLPSSPAISYTRDGMGPAYLRLPEILEPGVPESWKYEYARIGNSGEVVTFEKLDVNFPNLSPIDFLMYDLFGDNYALWDSPINIFRPNVRVDVYVQNYPVSSDPDRAIEITADAFLNWVRGSFVDTAGQQWKNFFSSRIGKYLRNTTIYRNEMFAHYSGNGIISPVPTPPRLFGRANVRLTPDETAYGNNLGFSGSEFVPLTQSPIYGWWEGPTYTWVLVDTTNTENSPRRLAWIVQEGIDVQPGDLTQANRIGNASDLSPLREFGRKDICTLLDLTFTDCV
jgi:hypothetical protein